ncbi:hypothetical protein ACWGDX_24135 [Streptomyces sp. NPDC055025]
MSDTDQGIDVRLAANLTVIRPGDTVLVRMPATAPVIQAKAVADRLRERLPDVDVLVIAGTDGIDIYRPTESPER